MLLVLWKKWFSHLSAVSRKASLPAEEQIKAIQAGDERLREAFIMQYRPFLAKTASKFCGRSIDPNHDDEFSIALAAFNEAINRYSPDMGSRFISFAKTVITRRLIDYARQEKRHRAAAPNSSFSYTEDDSGENGRLAKIQNAAAMEAFERGQEAESRREEIRQLSEQLSAFGIRFQDLVGDSPRHRDSRQTLLKIGRKIAASPDLFQSMLQQRRLPVKQICEAVAVSRKTVERHRKYLIAVSLIAGGPYPYLKEYIYGDDNE